MNRLHLPCSIATLALATACDLSALGPQGSGQASLTVAFEKLVGIEPADGHYEGWAIGQGAIRSLGKFLVGTQGKPTGIDGAAKTSWPVELPARSITDVYFTVEPPGDDDALPSRQVFLRGQVNGGTATLAPPIDVKALEGRKGYYILLNPVTDTDPSDWNGIWFEKFESGRYLPGLELDEAPIGWMYAGWVVLDGVVLRTGKFRRPDENDDWWGYSGLNSASLPKNFPGPPAPGEDFVKNLPPGVPTGYNKPDLAGARIVVSLESAALAGEERHPSPVRIFEGTVASPSVRLATYRLDNVAATRVPSATVTVN